MVMNLNLFNVAFQTLCRATFGLDVRSVAVYRMAVSSAMLYCLLIRWTDLEAMYTVRFHIHFKYI